MVGIEILGRILVIQIGLRHRMVVNPGKNTVIIIPVIKVLILPAKNAYGNPQKANQPEFGVRKKISNHCNSAVTNLSKRLTFSII
jgi:hypothetical protein